MRITCALGEFVQNNVGDALIHAQIKSLRRGGALGSVSRFEEVLETLVLMNVVYSFLTYMPRGVGIRKLTDRQRFH